MTEKEKLNMFEAWFEVIYPIYEYFITGKPEPFYYDGAAADKVYEQMKKYKEQTK